MKFKEFVYWCNERACDGYWGMITAMACIDITRTVKKQPFWKREYEQKVLDEIVNPINKKIEELTGGDSN